MDVINYILSFLPVKDPQYEPCIGQLQYFIKILNENRASSEKGTSNYYNKLPYYRFILRNNRSKMGYKQKKINLKIISYLY